MLFNDTQQENRSDFWSNLPFIKAADKYPDSVLHQNDEKQKTNQCPASKQQKRSKLHVHVLVGSREDETF